MSFLKKAIQFLIPHKVRLFVWSIIPKFEILNTYRLKNVFPFNTFSRIDSKYEIRLINWGDLNKLKKASVFRGKNAFKKRIEPRMKCDSWKGIAAFDSTNGDIAYFAWIVVATIDYLEEFGVKLKNGQFLLKDGYCIPSYRHQGLHTRMEQERINYCALNGATDIFIQIHDSNIKGKESVLGNGYVLHKQNYIIQWPVFNVYRELNSFIKKPFKKVVS